MKALIRYEFKILRWMLIYFILGFGYMAYTYGSILDDQYKWLILSPITSSTYVSNIGTQYLLSINKGMIYIGLIGIFLMIYLQVKDSKSIEVGRFLKALPISGKTYYKVKAVGGVLSITIPYLISCLWLISVKGRYSEIFNDFYSLHPSYEDFIRVESVGMFLQVLFTTYLILLFSYLFLMCMQYIISHPVSALVIGALVGGTPAYLGSILVGLYNEMGYGYYENPLEYLLPWAYTSNLMNLRMSYREVGSFRNASLFEIPSIEVKWAILLGLCILFWIVGLQLSCNYKVEGADQLIPSSIMKKVFIGGVVVCSACLPPFAQMIGINLRIRNMWIMSIAMLITAIIGLLVSKKIAYYGDKGGRS